MPVFEATPDNLAKMMQVAARLEGSCMSLEDGLESEFGEDVSVTDFSLPLLQELDAAVMTCEDCGWWCSTADLNEDQVCCTCA